MINSTMVGGVAPALVPTDVRSLIKTNACDGIELTVADNNTDVSCNTTYPGRPTDADYFATCRMLVAEIVTAIRPHMPEKTNRFMSAIELAINSYPLRGKPLQVSLPACSGVSEYAFILLRVLALSIEIIHKFDPRNAQWIGMSVKALSAELSAQGGA